jgi:galactofuranose transport system ATP-binding protein
VRALESASLSVGRSEIHALIGQNGAGKSTMLKVLTGAARRDAGSIRFDGRDVDFASPQAAQLGGISTIYQEVNLIGMRSIAENIFLGREPKRWGLIDWKRLNREASAILERFSIRADVTQPLETFNIAVQQMTAIARAVSTDAKLVVMDEPTSSLDEKEVDTLFRVIRQLKADGVSVIFVTHKLDELYEVCDRITVMRDGQTVFAGDMAGIGKLDLVARMLGKDLSDVERAGQTAFKRRDSGDAKNLVLRNTDSRTAGSRGATSSGDLLNATHLRRGVRLRDASLRVQPGEIVGLAGLLGAGRTETARVIFGADNLEGGEVRLEGKAMRLRSPADAIRAGMGFCSEDRKIEGIIPELSVRENLTLALLPMLSKAGIVDRQRQTQIVTDFIAKLGIKTSGPDQPIRELSGGNQQKVLLARWLCMNPKLLILDEPTRGIDVGAKGEIQALIGALAENGLGVLMISSEIEELTEGCDRVTVLRDGSSVADFTGDAITQDNVLSAMALGHTAIHEAELGDANAT